MHFVLNERRRDCWHRVFFRFIDSIKVTAVFHWSLLCVWMSCFKHRVGSPCELWFCPHLSFPGMALDDWGWWVLTWAVRLCPEGAGDFPMFAHPGLLIRASCSMTVAQGSAVLDAGTRSRSEQEDRLRAWLRANRVIMWQIHMSLLIRVCLVHRITLQKPLFSHPFHISHEPWCHVFLCCTTCYNPRRLKWATSHRPSSAYTLSTSAGPFQGICGILRDPVFPNFYLMISKWSQTE